MHLRSRFWRKMTYSILFVPTFRAVAIFLAMLALYLEPGELTVDELFSSHNLPFPRCAKRPAECASRPSAQCL